MNGAPDEILALARRWPITSRTTVGCSGCGVGLDPHGPDCRTKAEPLSVAERARLFRWVNRTLNRYRGNEAIVRETLGLDARDTIDLCAAARAERRNP